MKRWIWAVALVIAALGFTLRLYKLHNALGDWHSWRQSDTASVAREYAKHGIDLLHPTYQDLSSIPSGLDNPQGYRFVEFPLVNALHAEAYRLYPQLGFVEWGRVLTVVASSLTILLLFLLVFHLSGFWPAVFASLIYAVLPYNVYYGRVILPEPWLVLGMIAALYFWIRYWDTGRFRYWLVTFLSLTFALLMKPTALVVYLPMALYMFTKFDLRRSSSLLLTAFSLLPYLWWRHWMSQYPAGIPASSWLFNGNGIRFKGAWFRWLFGDRLGDLILGYWGLIPLGAGLVRLGEKRKELFVYGGLLVGSLTYLAIIATGNVQHDYYQIQIMPTIAIFVGLGIDYLLRLRKGFARVYVGAFVAFCVVLGLALSWYRVQGYFWVNNQAMVAAGQKLDSLAPPDALVIAPYMGDTAFLFQTNRRGWPIGGDIQDKIKKGARYYVTTAKDDEFNTLKKQYGVLVETDAYAIIKL